MDDGSGFDVVYWADPATLDTANFDLSAYTGRTLTVSYIALMSSDGLNASIDITQIALVATAPPPVVPLAGWTVDSSLTNAPYTLDSSPSLLSLDLTASDTSGRVTIYTLGVPALDLTNYDHIDVSVTGTANARILLRFFLDDGTGFDVVYWADPATLNAISFDLTAYAGRTLTIAYIALMSSDGSDASVDITEIVLVASAPAPVVPLSGWVVDTSLTNSLYTLNSTEALLSLDLDAVDTASRVTIYSLAVPSLVLGSFDHIDVAVTGTSNARVLLRFFLDDGTGFDVVYWADPTTLNAINFDLSAYAGRTLTIAYVALMSSDGSTASIDITQIVFIAPGN
jgi:phage-related protein